MRRPALFAVPLVLLAAGAFALAAAGGDRAEGARAIDPAAANERTAKAASVHYAVVVELTERKQPLTLHISGGSSRDALAVRLQLDALKMKNGTTLPGTDGAVRALSPFLYERAPSAMAGMLGKVRWLRLSTSGLPERSQTMSGLRALTPAPLFHVVAETKLHPVGTKGAFAGPVAYDDPVVVAALNRLSGGLEFRSLRVGVQVGRDGLVHRVRIDGRTADGKTTLRLRARLYGFGRPVEVVPPKPGTFSDSTLSQLQS
jgi:hypothetical protein